jgi:hypothetical protein
MTTTGAGHDAYTPRLFEHDLDPDLFAGDRLDWLTREAEKRDKLGVQWADPGRQRHGNEPIHTGPRFPVLEDAARRPVQYRIYGVGEWAPREYRERRDRIIEQHKPQDVDVAIVDSVVRVFAPHAIVALHGDPDLKLVCDVAGETIWYVRPPQRMTQLQHENLLRGEFFLKWEESDDEQALPIGPGTGCFVPSRWAHWLDHPSDEPVVSFELGFWTPESVRERKVHDVNWLLRRMKIAPAPPGGAADARKLKAFDVISTVTRKGTRYRGI